MTWARLDDRVPGGRRLGLGPLRRHLGRVGSIDRPDVLAAVAAWGLDSTHRLDGVALADADFTELLDACERHRLLGLLAGAIGDGSLRVTDEQRVAADVAVMRWLSHDLRSERVVTAVADTLEAAGIDYVLAKGVAIAHTVYADPSHRVFADVDLFVRSEQFSAAAAVLVREIGAERPLPELRAGFDDRFGREILLKASDVEIDLHRTLVDGPYGHMVMLDDLFDRAVSFSLGGRPVRAMRAGPRFLHACFAARLGDWPPRLMPQRDVVQLLADEEVTEDEVLMLAGRWRAEAVVASAVTMSVDTLGVGSDHALVVWARGHRIGRRDRVFLRSYQGTRRGYTTHALALAVIPGLRNRLAYGRALLRPDRAYLEARELSTRDRVRRVLNG